MAVLEKLRELLREAESENRRHYEVEECAYAAYDNLPALLALADAVKAKDQAAIDKALADLEKEAQ